MSMILAYLVRTLALQLILNPYRFVVASQVRFLEDGTTARTLEDGVTQRTLE